MKRIILSALALIAMTGAAHAQQRGPNLDADGDGKITLQEYQAGRGARLFERMDANSDGKLAKEELGPMLSRAPAGGDAAFAALDADKDGFVSRAEAEAMTAAAFRRADANGDGALSQDEMAAARQAMMGSRPPQ